MGGLFGSRLQEDGEVLGWTRAQQAAFLIYAWDKLRIAVASSKAEMGVQSPQNCKARHVRSRDDDPAFYGRFSLIATDQGVRGILQSFNDLCFAMAPKLKLDTCRIEGAPAATDEAAVATAIKSLAKHPLGDFINQIAKGLAGFDWRTSAIPDIAEALRRQKLVFRGGSGYKELRAQILEHLAASPGDLGRTAGRISSIG